MKEVMQNAKETMVVDQDAVSPSSSVAMQVKITFAEQDARSRLGRSFSTFFRCDVELLKEFQNKELRSSSILILDFRKGDQRQPNFILFIMSKWSEDPIARGVPWEIYTSLRYDPILRLGDDELQKR
jgi:hypothetical protein